MCLVINLQNKMEEKLNVCTKNICKLELEPSENNCLYDSQKYSFFQFSKLILMPMLEENLLYYQKCL